jgi:hypothetical protein
MLQQCVIELLELTHQPSGRARINILNLRADIRP